MDRRARHAFERRQFDPVGIVLRHEQRLEGLFTKAIRDARHTRSALERAALYRVAAQVLEQIKALMQDVGILDSQVGLLIRAMRGDGPKVERTPNGLELQEWFNSIRVTDDELISSAELSYLGYGDSEALHRERARKAGR